MNQGSTAGRRTFFKKSGVLLAGLAATPFVSVAKPTSVQTTDSLYMIGPQEGYTPRIGTLLSTMTMMRTWIVGGVANLTMDELDFQLDDTSNSIGAMLLHLAATERYYQLNTFDEMEWDSWSKKIKKEWDLPMNLGEEGRKMIKGNNIDYYLSKLEEVREVTKMEFAKRNDDWLMTSEPFFENKPTNNHCKWFHVCEHESNHNGQIKFIMKRIPA